MTEVTRREVVRVFGRIGLLSFGGPAGQIALMHRELVDRGWLGEKEFLRALSFCMLLPGPEAMQLATYAGWRLAGVAGGLIAGLLFVLPGAAIVLALSLAYVAVGDVPLVEAAFLGVKAAVVAIVLEALLRVARRALSGPADWIVAGLSFAAIFLLSLPFPAIVLAAGIWGFLRGGGTEDATLPPASGSLGGTIRTVALWLAIWFAPVAALWLSGARFLTELALFFSTLAVVTFGGAYAVLAYMAQAAVEAKGWLGPGEMMDGLGLAETTPGPLILVTEFVGFLAGVGAGGIGLGLAAAVLTLWVTFVPCFLWIFAGAPWLDRLTARPRLRGALAAITAAVVGVILNLSLWFAAHVLFAEVERIEAGPLATIRPVWSSLDPWAALLAAGSAVLLLLFHWPIPRLLGLAAAGGALTVLL